MTDSSPFEGGPAPTPPPGPVPGSGRATASLILGLCSLFLWLCPFVGLAASITGLVLGIQARRMQRTGMATAGVVLCVIGLAASLINAAIGTYLGATQQHPLVNKLMGG